MPDEADLQDGPFSAAASGRNGHSFRTDVSDLEYDQRRFIAVDVSRMVEDLHFELRICMNHQGETAQQRD
jgi:hypothetical protein